MLSGSWQHDSSADGRDGQSGGCGLQVLLVTLGSIGDVMPFLAVAERLRARGHRCVFASNAGYAQLIQASGFAFAIIAQRPRKSLDEVAWVVRILPSDCLISTGYWQRLVERLSIWIFCSEHDRSCQLPGRPSKTRLQVLFAQSLYRQNG
jgi:hypothetical protein